MRSAGVPVASNHATRAERAVVLPVPAPARTRSGPPSWLTAVRWASLSSSIQANICSIIARPAVESPPLFHGAFGRPATVRRPPVLPWSAHGYGPSDADRRPRGPGPLRLGPGPVVLRSRSSPMPTHEAPYLFLDRRIFGR